ncbi:helix-turn-helix domain-containing protein [Nocardia sp. NPDC005978]|uniref:PucR family transcriptional regulator n=1 Tax=Nocardia sp. NPDC005978 TaxID=3156725 RepID=UPI0033BE7813
MPLPLTPLRMDSPLLRRVVGQLAGLAQDAVSGAVAEVGVYRQLSAELAGPELNATALSHLLTFLAVAEQGREAGPGDLAAIMVSAGRRAEERIPLSDVLDAYLTGARVVWQAVIAAAGPQDRADVESFVAHLLAFLHRTTVAITATYVRVHATVSSVERDARHALCAALLAGQDAGNLAAQAEFALVRSYSVVTLTVAGVPSRPGNTGELASARRRVRQAHDLVERRHGGEHRLVAFDGHSGVLLLPAADSVSPEALVRDLAAAFALPVTAALAPAAEVEAIPAAFELAREIYELARALDRPAGLYRLSDLMVEYQITRPGPARDALEAVLGPLREHPHLLETLRVNMRYGLDRQAAAKALGLHANTYSYRLRRIAEVTGLDATDAADARVLASAMLASSTRRNPQGRNTAEPRR